MPDAETLKSLPSAAQAYGASKVLAHTAGSDFIKENQVQFKLVRVLPGYIQGANELYRSAADMRDEAILGSNEGTMLTALGVKVGHPRITHQVYLDDVAKAHVLALSADVNSGDNLLVVGNKGISVPWSDFVPLIQKQFPDAVARGIIDPKAEDESVGAKFDVASTEELLGYKFGGPEEIIKSVVGQYLALVESV